MSNMEERGNVASHRPTFRTPQHRRVESLLHRLISEGTAQFYSDACRILHSDPPLKTTAHLVGHLCREVESSVREVLAQLPEAQDVFVSEQKSAIEKRAKPEHQLIKTEPRGPSHRAQIDAILTALELRQHPEAETWHRLRKRGWHKIAHREKLGHPRIVDDEFYALFEDFTRVLHTVLDAAEAQYTEVLEWLLPLATRPPASEGDAKLLATYLAPGVAALNHVFDALSKEWLAPLKRHDVFSHPPGPLVYEDGSFSFRPWPHARYLQRVAPEMPDEVSAIIEALSPTANELLEADVIEVALALPPTDAERVARRTLSWLKAHKWHTPRFSDALGRLVTHLWKGGRREFALNLLRVALELFPPDDAESRGAPEARTTVDWCYTKLVQATIPSIAQSDAKDADLAVDLLLDLIASSKGEPRQRVRYELSGEIDPGFHEPLEVLCASLIKLLTNRIEEQGQFLHHTIERLESLESSLFRRVALHLLRLHGKLAPGLVLERVTDVDRLTDGAAAKEMMNLIRDQLANFADEEQEVILSAVSDAARHRSGLDIDDPSFDDEGGFSSFEHELHRSLHHLREALPAEWRRKYEQLLGRYGEPLTDEPTIAVPRRLPTFLEPAELAELSDEHLFDYLRDHARQWNERRGPSISSLAERLRRAVHLDLHRFSRLASEYRYEHPTYAAGIAQGLGEALHELHTSDLDALETDENVNANHDNTTEPDWDSMLDLAAWIANQKSPPLPNVNPEDWRRARRSAISLAEMVFITRAPHLSHVLRAWRIIQAQLSDPDPSPEREPEDLNDLNNVGFRSVRGTALSAAINAASIWKRREGQIELLDTIYLTLQERAQPGIEPSLAVRSVLAERFSQLCAIDERVAREIATSLFSPNTTGSSDHLTLWRVFIKWNRASAASYRILESSYELALENLGIEEQHDIELGKHLAQLAMHGELTFRSHDGQLQRFVERAASSVRSRTLSSIGWAIRGTEVPIPEDVRDRLCAIWNWWVPHSLASGDPSDLSTFGYWFTTHHFDPEWLLAELERALKATHGAIDWDHEVIEKLVGLADDYPAATAAALALLADADDPWPVQRSSREILKILAKLTGTEADLEARKIGSKLLTKHAVAYADLPWVALDGDRADRRDATS